MQVIDPQSRVPSPLKFEVVTAPAVEPVSTQELVDFLRLPSLTDRDVVNALAVAGRQYVEQRTRQTLINTTFDLWLDDFPEEIYLPARPLSSVTYVKYTDQAGVVQTLSTSAYNVDGKGPQPKIVPVLGTVFPFPKVQYPNAVQVRFVAGFGTTATAVPEYFKLCIKQFVALNYEQREGVVFGKQPFVVPYTFDHLLRLSSLPEV